MAPHDPSSIQLHHHYPILVGGIVGSFYGAGVKAFYNDLITFYRKVFRFKVLIVEIAFAFFKNCLHLRAAMPWPGPIHLPGRMLQHAGLKVNIFVKIAHGFFDVALVDCCERSFTASMFFCSVITHKPWSGGEGMGCPGRINNNQGKRIGWHHFVEVASTGMPELSCWEER